MPKIVYNYRNAITRERVDGGEVISRVARAYGEWPSCLPKEWKENIEKIAPNGDFFGQKECSCGRHTLVWLGLPGQFLPDEEDRIRVIEKD